MIDLLQFVTIEYELRHRYVIDGDISYEEFRQKLAEMESREAPSVGAPGFHPSQPEGHRDRFKVLLDDGD